MLLLLLIAIAVAVLLVLRAGRSSGPPPRPAAPSVAFGVNADTEDSATASLQDKARALGVGWLREDLRWPDVEPRPGRFSDGRYDALFAAAARRRLRILPVLFLTPGWASREGKTSLPPLRPWATFVAHVAARYGPHGTFWRAHPGLDPALAPDVFEVWNEPFYSYFSAGHPDAAAYAKLVAATVRAGRAADRDVRFLAAMDTRYTAAGGHSRDWATDVFAAQPGLARAIGGVAVHPYTPASPRDGGPQAFDRVDAILRAYRQAGGRARRPLWITELGWSTCPARPTCVGEREQATYWRQALGLLTNPPLSRAVGGIFAYDLLSYPVKEPDDPLGAFGLLDAAGRPKPAYAVFAAAARSAARPSARKASIRSK